MNRTSLQPIASLAQARRFYTTAAGAALGVTAALLALAALAAIDVAHPIAHASRVGLLAALLALLAAWFYLRWRRIGLLHTPHSAVRAVEGAHPEVGQQLRTALEIAGRGVRSDAPFEEKLFAEQLVVESERALRRFSWRGLIPRWQFFAWLAAGAAVSSAVCFCAVQSPNFRFALSRFLRPGFTGTYTGLEWTSAPKSFDDRHPPRFELRVARRLAEPFLYIREGGGGWIRTSMTPLPDGRTWDIVLTGRTADLEMYATAGDARTAPMEVKFEPIAKLMATHVHLEFPEYTALAPEEREKGDVTVVEDTRVRWNFTFNVVPKRLEWRVGSEAPQSLPVDAATKTATVEWRAGMSRDNAVVSVLDASGQPIDSWHFVAEGFADGLPKVEILEPGQDREATSVSEIPVRIRAKDDFGISEIGLIIEAAGQREWVLEKVIPDLHQREVTEIATVSLEKIPLTIRDNVRIYAYALDHKPRGGPRAVSPLRSVDIRQFKKRWRFLEGGGIGNFALIAQSVAQVGQLVSEQRAIVSDTFLLRESTRSAGAAVTASARPIAERESGVGEKAEAIRDQWIERGVPRDDVMLLSTAQAQTVEAAESLGLEEQANLDKGFPAADRALTTLLQLRKALLTLLARTQGPGDSQKPEEHMRTLADLAREAERLAKEEHEVRGQLAPEVAAGTNIEATRRQQDIVVDDGGELYAALVDHPQSIEAAVRLMGEAEKAYRGAGETLRGAQPPEAAPALVTAEARLLEVAKFLRAMELNDVAETLTNLARDAEKDAQVTRGSAEGKKPSGGSAGSGRSESKNPSPQPAEAKSEPSKDGQAKTELAQQGNAQREAEQAVRDTALADEILGALAEKAGATSSAADQETANSFSQSLGQRLAELRERVGAAKLAEELEKLAAAPSTDDAGKANARSEAAGKLDSMAGAFRDAARTIAAARSALLAFAQAQANQLKKQLGGSDDKGDQQANGNEKGKNGAKGQGAGQKPGQNGAGKQAGDQPGKGGAGDKPGEQGLANKDSAGQKDSGKANGNRPNGVAKGKATDAGSGDKPGDSKQKGGGGIAGNNEKAQEGPGGQAMGRFAQSLRAIGDDKLHELSIKLFNEPFSREALPTIEEALERIGELLSALPAANAPIAASGSVPEARRREVEDYFRNLSDDFAGEEKGDALPPGEKSP